MNITLRQLQAFIAVADSGSFTGAAGEMHIAQSAVSVLVRDLERDLGVRLFDRTTRRVELTETGAEFRDNAAQIIANLDHAVRHTHDLAERKRGRVTVAAPPFLATVLLPNVIATFNKEFPGVRILLIDARTDQIIDRVKSGEADIGVGTFRLEDDGLVRMHLASDKLMLFCTAKHPLATAQRAQWRDLQGMALVTLTRESGIRTLVESGYEAAGIPFAPAYEVTQITTALALIEAGLGVGVLPSYALLASSNRRVAARNLGNPTISRDIVVVARRGRTPPPAAGDFIARLHRATALIAGTTAARSPETA